jgi:signal transduction histidine kinase/CheY-like chemotaxis protein/HPt (histidine-containing phosphotransfer) domain-containing protein
VDSIALIDAIRPPWDRLSRLGVSAGMDPREAKRIILVNRMAATIFGLGIPYGILLQALGFWLQQLFTVLLGAGMAGVLILNRFGMTTASRVCYLSACYLSIAAACVLMGKETGIQLYFFNTALSALFFFGWDRKKTLAAGLLAGPACWVALIWTDTSAFPHAPMPKGLTPILLTLNVLTSFFIFLVEFLHFFSANRKTEAALAQAVEAATSADKAKSQFLANISHEVRTPLNGILGLSELVADTPLRPDQLESVQTIRASATDLLEMINGILDLSKIEAGKMQLEAVPFRLTQVLESLERLFRPQATRKGLAWVADVDPAVPDRLLGDPVRLKQVLTNLIGNAIKFTDEGSVVLRVGLQAPVGDKMASLAFEVADTGIGISPAAQKKLFQAFLQADASTTRKYGGTGLGLHLSKDLVERMGGSIGFFSEPGKGSRFHFSTPFPLAAPETIPAGSGAPEGPDPRIAVLQALPKPRVLIVEDHPVNQKVLAGMLARFGWSADTALNGIEALQAFSQGPYDLVFLDSHMPEMDGYECARNLRKLKTGSPRPILIGVTADAMAGSREKSLAAGMDGMITKPILTSDLLAVLMPLWVAAAAASDRRPAQTARPEPAPAPEEWTDSAMLEGMNQWIAVYNPDFWPSTLDLFDKSYRKIYGRMKTACEAGDFRQAGDEAHALKGACATLGLWRMTEVCRSLEAMSLGGETSEWPRWLERLEEFREPSLAEVNKKVKGR